MDLKHSDGIMIMGSNMAECHPVAFRWVMQAKTRESHPCTVIHVDPRFTRTSAMANIYAPLRAGSDIVLLGALIHYVLKRHESIFEKPAAERTPREQFFHDYLVHYTNAATLVTEEFKDAEDNDLAGVFSGFDPAGRRYDARSWRYETDAPDTQPKPGEAKGQSFSAQVGQLAGPRSRQDATLQNPHCVWQVLRRHFSRYTPEL